MYQIGYEYRSLPKHRVFSIATNIPTIDSNGNIYIVSVIDNSTTTNKWFEGLLTSENVGYGIYMAKLDKDLEPLSDFIIHATLGGKEEKLNSGQLKFYYADNDTVSFCYEEIDCSNGCWPINFTITDLDPDPEKTVPIELIDNVKMLTAWYDFSGITPKLIKWKGRSIDYKNVIVPESNVKKAVKSTIAFDDKRTYRNIDNEGNFTSEPFDLSFFGSSKSIQFCSGNSYVERVYWDREDNVLVYADAYNSSEENVHFPYTDKINYTDNYRVLNQIAKYTPGMGQFAGQCTYPSPWKWLEILHIVVGITLRE